MPNTQSSREPPADHWAPFPPALTATDSDVRLVLTHADRIASTDTLTRAQRARGVGQLGVRSERRGSDHVIVLSGELDLANAHTVQDNLDAVEATDARQITIDLRPLDFIDSTGLALIIAANARSRADGNRLRLLHGPPHVQRIFDITDMTDRLPFAH